MELFIQIRDGQPYEHPIFGDNFREAFPDIDTSNLPPEFARFERIPIPDIGVYEIAEGPVYQWVNGIVKDVWTVRPMTAEEKQQKISEAMAEPHPDGWIFNEQTCEWEQPALANPGAPPNVIG